MLFMVLFDIYSLSYFLYIFFFSYVFTAAPDESSLNAALKQGYETYNKKEKVIAGTCALIFLAAFVEK